MNNKNPDKYEACFYTVIQLTMRPTMDLKRLIYIDFGIKVCRNSQLLQIKSKNNLKSFKGMKLTIQVGHES